MRKEQWTPVVIHDYVWSVQNPLARSTNLPAEKSIISGSELSGNSPDLCEEGTANKHVVPRPFINVARFCRNVAESEGT